MKQGLVFRIRNEPKAENTPDVKDPDEGGVMSLQGKEGGEAVAATRQQAAEEVSDSGVKEIILKGPIGHAYTEALMHLLNKKDNRTGVIRTESNMTQLLAGGLAEEQEEELTPAEANRAYIFVSDGRRMNLGEIDAMVNHAIDTKVKNPNAGYIGMVIEGLDEIATTDNTKSEFIGIQALHLESEYDIKVMFTRSRALTKMESFLGV